MSILVIDCGTSACRAVRYPAEGGAAESERREAVPATVYSRSGAGADTEQLWPVVLRLLRWGAELGPVDAVGISTFFAYLLRDSDGRLLGPASTWADRSAAADARAVRGLIPDPVVHSATGRVPTGELLIPKLMHVRRTSPAAFARVHSVCGLKDEFVRRLTGRAGTDFAHADYSLGFRPGTMVPFDEIWESYGLSSDILKPASSAASSAGTVTRDASAATGLREGTPVARGATDGTAAMYGCGILAGRGASLVCGTTDVLMVHVPAVSVRGPMDDLRVTCNTAMSGGGLLAGGAMGFAGGAASWLSGLLRRSVEDLEVLASRVPAGCEGLFMLPSLTGERAPFWNEAAAGTFVGMRTAHGPGHLFRACLEGSAVRLRLMVEVLEAAGVAVSGVRMAGGAAKSALWNRIRADASGITVSVLEDREATSRGTALFCAAMLDGRPEALFPLTDAWVRDESMLHPDASMADLYRLEAERYRSVLRLYESAPSGGE